ncbi:MAG: hypothetical protein H6Q90_3208 [Deltaproteobacteria bacterium]|nr:hypothetical protein [Deltaproteobacteria bacterium]
MYALPYVILMRVHQAAITARRRSRSWHYLAWSAVAGVLASLMIALGASIVLLLWGVGLWWFSIPMAGFMILPVIASPLARHLFVPLGWHRVGYYAGLLSRPGDDAPAYGLCVAAWAFAHRPSPAAEAWIARRRDARKPLGDGEVVVTALVAAGRGDADTARPLLRSVAMLIEDHPAVRELAGEWLATDAAERGAWSELASDALAARWPATPLTYFLEGVACCRIGSAGAPSPSELRARWLLAPYRGTTRGLLEVPVVAAPPPAPTEAVALAPDAGSLEPAPVDGGPLPRAVAAHLAFRSHDPSANRLAATVRAWDAALADGATHGWLARRALELDAPLGAVDRALREVTAAITDELAHAAERARLGAPASQGPVGDGLARRLRHGRLDALETGFTRWSQRRHDGEAHAAIDEWREFIALQAAYDVAVEAGGTELRRLAFPHAFSTGSNMAAWLWNARNEYALSHAISKWLLAEALAVGDTEAIELGHRNCGLHVPHRLGKPG